MIGSIKLKNITSYDPTNGVELSDLKRLNFFFGFNGSGKSTIAKYIYDLSLPDKEKSPEFVNCSQIGYDSENEQILVFDENFTEINFNRNSSLKGVFSLNEQNDIIDTQIKDKENLIVELKREKDRKSDLKQSIDKDKNQQKRNLLDFCWSQRSTFSPFTKITLVYPGSKPNHLRKLEQELQSSLEPILSIEQLSEEYNLLYEKEINEIEDNINILLYKQIRRKEIELQGLLEEIIVGNEDIDISGLINILNSRSWVETGIGFLEKSGETCPFCQQKTITKDLENQFSELFDETYRMKIDKLNQLLNQYRVITTSFIDGILSIQKRFNQNNIVSELYVKLQKLIDSNVLIIESKISSSNEKKYIKSLVSFKSELSSIIFAINENNKIFYELENKRKNLVGNIWKFMASSCKDRIIAFNDRGFKYERINSLADELILKCDEKITNLKEIIESLRGQTINTKEAVDNINLILKNSGFESFEIAEKDTVNNISQYYLKRPNTTNNNPIFKSLSEGEKSFIAFLYFYQLCVGTDDIQVNSSKKKIIVIDDPVSSLDSQALFVVSSLIHQLILRKGDDSKPNRKLFKNENITQVFVLTHNIYFYKEVSFDKRPLCTDYWHYKVSKVNNKTNINGQYNKTIFDDYSMLWQTTREIKVNLPQDSSLNIVIANTLRRIIESYVNFIGLGKDSWSSILNNNQNNPDYYLKCAFISVINNDSHKVSALDSVYYHKLSSEQPEILFNVFRDIFKEIGKEHYEMLMEENIED